VGAFEITSASPVVTAPAGPGEHVLVAELLDAAGEWVAASRVVEEVQ